MIRLQDVTKQFWHEKARRRVTALDGVGLHVARNEFVCVLGPSGCGKSTLLNLVGGFERPSSGRVLFDGRDVTAPGPDRGVVFQDHALFPWLTARQNVEFGLRHAGVPSGERAAVADEFLRMVGLNGFADARPHALSGGMRQRVALARVLALEPKALLMDEPFGALDALSRNRLQDELIRIWESHRTTVLFVTHSVEEAAYLADRVVLLGPAPSSLRGDVPVPVARPRRRRSGEMREIEARLGRELAAMPCCLPPDGLPEEPDTVHTEPRVDSSCTCNGRGIGATADRGGT